MYRYHQNSKNNFGIALKSRYLVVVRFLLLFQYQSVLLLLSVLLLRPLHLLMLNIVVTDPQVMDFVTIHFFAVHNGVTAELDPSIVMRLDNFLHHPCQHLQFHRTNLQKLRKLQLTGQILIRQPRRILVKESMQETNR